MTKPIEVPKNTVIAARLDDVKRAAFLSAACAFLTINDVDATTDHAMVEALQSALNNGYSPEDTISAHLERVSESVGYDVFPWSPFEDHDACDVIAYINDASDEFISYIVERLPVMDETTNPLISVSLETISRAAFFTATHAFLAIDDDNFGPDFELLESALYADYPAANNIHQHLVAVSDSVGYDISVFSPLQHQDRDDVLAYIADATIDFTSRAKAQSMASDAPADSESEGGRPGMA